MNLLVIGLSSFMIALSGALVPGPLFTITVSESIKKGAHAGPMLILGHGILELLIVVLLLSGLSPLIDLETTRYAIKLIGGIMLIIMGLMMIKDIRTARLDLSGRGNGGRSNLVVTGIMGSISNPYWIIWWATIGLGYLISSMKHGIPGIAVFFLGHISADLVWYSLISFTVAKGRRFIGEKGYKILLLLCACFLIFFGGWFLSRLGN